MDLSQALTSQRTMWRFWLCIHLIPRILSPLAEGQTASSLLGDLVVLKPIGSRSMNVTALSRETKKQ